jgi:hypothetical protein
MPTLTAGFAFAVAAPDSCDALKLTPSASIAIDIVTAVKRKMLFISPLGTRRPLDRVSEIQAESVRNVK